MESFRLRCRQRGGGFVQHQDFRVDGQGLGNLDQLFLGEAQGADAGARLGMFESDHVEQVRCTFVRELAPDARQRRG